MTPSHVRRRRPGRAPLVSVLTPSYNQARWLAQNLRSVERQTYPRIEHVVADGASTDGSLEILRRAPGICFRSEPDRGQSHALNKAFAESRGEIIGWVNSDDAYFDARAVEAAVSVFRARPEVGVVYGHAALVDPGDRALQILWAPPYSYRLLRRHNFIVQPTAFVRRAVLERQFADESFEWTMDRELWLRLGAVWPMARVDLVVAVDRHQPDRKSIAKLDFLRADERRLVELYRLPTGPLNRALGKSVKVAGRIAGARKIRPAIRAEHPFDVAFDRVPTFLARQLLIPRARMPLEAAAG